MSSGKGGHHSQTASGHGLKLTLSPPDPDGCCRITLSGRLTFSASDEFARALAFLDQCAARRCLLDLSGLSNLDSAGLWMIQEAHEKAQAMDMPCAISGASQSVRAILALANLPLAKDGDGQGGGQPLILVTPASHLPLLAPQAHKRGWAIATQDEALPTGHLPVLTGSASRSRIESALRQPFCGFLECLQAGVADVGRACLGAMAAGGLGLSVSTRTAYGHEIVPLFCQGLHPHLPVNSRLCIDDISACLGEAISNAVIHGNLGIDSTMRATRDGFCLFRSQMKERLAHDTLGLKRIEIAYCPDADGGAVITVADRGQGFDITRIGLSAAELGAKFGRGIALIRRIAKSVDTDDGGRTLVMAF